MRRLLRPPGLPENVVSLAEWAARKKKAARRVRSESKAAVAEQVARMEEMRRTGDWSAANAGTFVALYRACHMHVYGTEPEELAGAEWSRAKLAAHRVLEGFGFDNGLMVDFVRWAWAKEQRQHERAAGTDRRRMGWRLQFSASMVTDYKVSVLSKQKARR